MICLDGCGPEYLRLAKASFIMDTGKSGCYVEGKSIIPSVTNVNAVSILTGKFPEEHGITTNYYFDRETGQEVYMESPSFIKTKTLLELGMSKGFKTALITSKEKLRSLLNRGVAVSFSAEKPLPWLTKTIGPPPSIYSIEVDIWLIKALKELIYREDPTIIFTMTTDYAMHKYAPEEKESKIHINGIDEILREIMETLEARGDEVLLCITADHGMSKKDKAINLELTLKTNGIISRMNTIIADRYIVHHSNLGGAAYIYLKNLGDAARSLEILKATEGVEFALPLDEASRLYHLDKMRIGDFFVLAKKDYVFGHIEEEIEEVMVRSHGSLHEGKIPIIVNASKSEFKIELCENKDVANIVKDWFSI